MILGGLLAFTAGFAVAGILVTLGEAAKPPYLVAITVGLVGIGVTGVAMSRGTTPMPQSPIWSRSTLTLLAAAVPLPPMPVMATLYVLGAVGVGGNIVFPLTVGG